MTISIGEPKRNKDYQKAHFPKRTTDDTESQAMARFAVVEQPSATPATSAAMSLAAQIAVVCSPRSSRRPRPSTDSTTCWLVSSPSSLLVTDDIAAAWVLQLLEKYPTAERIAGAQHRFVGKIPIPHQRASSDTTQGGQAIRRVT